MLQDASLHIATHIGRLRDPATFVSWAFTIIRRRAADHIRGNQRQRALAGALENDVAAAADGHGDDRDELHSALAQLSHDQANLVTLFYAYGLSVNELAGVFALPTGTIKSRLYRARQQLKTLLDDKQETANE